MMEKKEQKGWNGGQMEVAWKKGKKSPVIAFLNEFWCGAVVVGGLPCHGAVRTAPRSAGPLGLMATPADHRPLGPHIQGG